MLKSGAINEVKKFLKLKVRKDHTSCKVIGINEIRDFLNRFKDIIIKPLYGNGGFGIFRVKEGDKNFQSLVEILTLNQLPIVVQRFIPEIEDGDRRVILIDGEHYGHSIRKDTMNFWNNLEDNGYCIFHDYNLFKNLWFVALILKQAQC